jgi:hypothetical protein
MENARRQTLTNKTTRIKLFATSSSVSTNAIQQKPQSIILWCQSMLHIPLKTKPRSSNISRHRALLTNKTMMQTLLFASVLLINAFNHVCTSTAQ